MVRYNSDIIFVDTSGQVISRFGDLTLRANANGTGYVIVGSGVGLTPEQDCVINLGTDWLRWNTLYACSGEFRDRISVNGSGVLLQGEAAASTTIPSGLASVEVNFTPEDGTEFAILHNLGTENFVFNIWRNDVSPIEYIIPDNVYPSGSNHAVIQISSPVSGKIVIAGGFAENESIGATLQTAYDNSILNQEIILKSSIGALSIADATTSLGDSGRKLLEITNNNDTIAYLAATVSGMLAPSGYITHRFGVALPDGLKPQCELDVSGLICSSGIHVEGSRPTVNGSGVLLEGEAVTSASGASILDQINLLPQKVIAEFTPTSGMNFVLEHGLNTEDFSFTMWRVDGRRILMSPQDLYPSGLNHAAVELSTESSGVVVFIG